MISTTQLKDNLYAMMGVMSKSPGMYIDVIYKGSLYRLTVDDLGVEVVQRRRPRKHSLADNVDAKKCPQCKKLMLNNVCMSSLCPSNSLVKTQV